jgi:poly-gamma-glutamate capsule biosynthesis protein CapA/YwtB (metallophosphatase superfamily)
VLRSRAALALPLALLLAGCGGGAGPGPPDGSASATAPASVTPAPTAAAGPDGVTLVATGDVLIHQGLDLTAGAQRPDGGYDFSDVLAPVAPIIRAADVAVCHLETPVAPPEGPFRGYPSFDVQPQIVGALAAAGFDQCSTASNHSLDAGFDGVVRTLDTLDAAGIAHTGSYRTEADSLRPDILDVHGVRIGFVAATFGLNGIPEPAGRHWAVDVAAVPDVAGMLAAAARARAAGADIVVASLHCCVEYEHDPTQAQVAAVHALLASPDVDLVIGHHAHVVQPVERVDGKWAAYGLGNFVAEMARPGPTYDSVVVRFTFTRGADGRFAVTRAQAVPLRIEVDPGAVRVVPADPVSADRVSAVLDARGAAAAGLEVVQG